MTEPVSERLSPPGLHVILGDSAAGTFRRAFHPDDRLVIDRDVLSCGPTPCCADLAGWCEVRRRFWRNVVPGSTAEPRAADFGFIGDGARFHAADQITIWTATGVSEQLFTAHVVHRVGEMGIDTAKLRWVQFETARSSVGRVVGIGELDERDMHEHPQRVPIPAATLRAYRDAWTAITSPDPALLEQFAGSHADASAWLRQATQLLLRRFPDMQSGLPWWDIKLLKEVNTHGPRAARVIGYTMANNWDDGDPVGDFYLFARMLRLGDAHLPARLLEITGNRRNMRETDVALTPFGHEVLEGKACFHPINPIDDWVAGVRLSSADGVLWFNDNGKLVKTE